MNALFVLIIISICIAGGFLLAFLWAIRNGQYDDKYTPSLRILLDNPTPNKTDTQHIRKAE